MNSTLLHRIALILILAGGGAWLGLQAAAEQELREFGKPAEPTEHDKAFYLDPEMVAFVRPGLNVKLSEPTIGQDGRLRVKIRITDPRGLPLDRDGIFTPGTVAVSFVAAHLSGPGETYVAYTTRRQTSTITGQSATQAGTDTGGTWEKLEDGLYRYSFGTLIPNTYDPATTHAIGVYSSRNLTEFDLGTQYSNDVLEFVPNGSPVTARRDRVATATCNNCHDPLSAHGGARREVRLCVLCHTPQTTDPDTGNTVNMTEMAHKIHMGEELPSVRAGRPYRIIGFNNTVFDFSEVRFPGDVRRCETCHVGTTQARHFMTQPTRAACGACHDDIDWASGRNHVNLPQASDQQCSTCHQPEGELEFDASVKGSHVVPEESAGLPGVRFEILGVENASPGSRPTVRFTIKNKAGTDVPPSQMTTLRLVMNGPATDYAMTPVSEDARQATVTAGVNFYTYTRAIPADFKGTMAVGIEGYQSRTLRRGNNTQLTVRDAGLNRVFYFDTQGGTARPRTRVVAQERCLSCHGNLLLHGGQRRAVEFCVLCHTPAATDQARRPADKAPNESIHFKTLIHKIHSGEELTNDFTVYGFGNTPHNYNKILFPGDRRNCLKCHNTGTQQLPISEGRLASTAPRDLLNPMQPITAACLSCHTTRPAAVHAQLQASPLGEACAVCHGPGREFSVDRAHAR